MLIISTDRKVIITLHPKNNIKPNDFINTQFKLCEMLKDYCVSNSIKLK